MSNKNSRIRLLFIIFLIVFSVQFRIGFTDNTTRNGLEVENQSGTVEAPKIKRWLTESGAEVLFLATSGIPIIDVAIDIDAGGRWDPSGYEGLAGLTSSMIFKGLGRVEGQSEGLNEEAILEFFANNSIVNSIDTGKDRVTIKLRFLNNSELQSKVGDFISLLLSNPAFNTEVLQREKTNLILRLRESLSRPQTIATRALWKAMYQDHPYGAVATEESISKLEVAHLKAFYNRFWQPARFKISIVGSLSQSEASALANQFSSESDVFSSETKDEPELFFQSMIPPVLLGDAGTKIISHDANQSHIWIGMPVLARHQTDDIFPFFVANHILGGSGFGSRLTSEIREERGLAYSVFSAFQLLKQKGPFFIGLQTGRGKTDEAIKIVFDTLDDYIEKGPTDEEIELAKLGLIGGFSLKLDSNLKLLTNLSQIAFYDLPLNYLDMWISRVSSVTKEDVNRVLKRVVKSGELQLVIVGGQRNSE